MRQKLLKISYCFLLTSFLSFNGCKNPDYSPPPVNFYSLSEPVVKSIYSDHPKFLFKQEKKENQTGQKSKKSSLTINDYITFPFKTDNGKLATSKDLQKAQIKILTTCMSKDNKVFKKNIQQNLRLQIPVIDLLPIEILKLNHSSPPVCDFYFTVIQDNSLHAFNISKTPLTNYKNSHLIDIIRAQNKKITLDYPYIFFEYKNNQIVIKDGDNTFFVMDQNSLKAQSIFSKVDSFRLECDHWTSTYVVNRDTGKLTNSKIPVNVFLKHKITGLNKDKLLSNPFQNCRIFSFYQEHIVATSLSFFLINLSTQVTPSVKLKFSDEEAQSFYHALQGMGEPYPNRPDINIYSYHISNPYSHPLSILINNYKEKNLENEISIYGLYAYNFDYTVSNRNTDYKKTFYVKESDIIKWGAPYLLSSPKNKLFYRPLTNSKALLITIPPLDEIILPIFITKNIQLLYPRKYTPLHWLGAIIHVPNLSISYLPSNNQVYTNPKSHILFKKKHSFDNEKRLILHSNWTNKKNIKDYNSTVLTFRLGIHDKNNINNLPLPVLVANYAPMRFIEDLYSDLVFPIKPKLFEIFEPLLFPPDTELNKRARQDIYEETDRIVATVIPKRAPGILTPKLRAERRRLIADQKITELKTEIQAMKYTLQEKARQETQIKQVFQVFETYRKKAEQEEMEEIENEAKCQKRSIINGKMTNMLTWSRKWKQCLRPMDLLKLN